MNKFLLFILLAFGMVQLEAAYVLKHGKLINKNELPTLPVQEHFSAAMDAYQKQEWGELSRHALVVKKNFATSPFYHEATFFLGAGYFHQKEYELANVEFSEYLKKQATSRHFEEAIQYKFEIAQKFSEGEKKHLMGWEALPKLMPAKDAALHIYEEVIAALPHHDLGARSLFGKAKLLIAADDYKESIEAYQTLIRRFPKHDLTADSYLGIASVFLRQCKNEYPDPDLLELAEINLRKFRADFPTEERLTKAQGMLRDMEEVYAKRLYETAQFFERTKKPHASLIYYKKVVTKYPETKLAELSRKRVEALESKSS